MGLGKCISFQPWLFWVSMLDFRGVPKNERGWFTWLFLFILGWFSGSSRSFSREYGSIALFYSQKCQNIDTVIRSSSFVRTPEVSYSSLISIVIKTRIHSGDPLILRRTILISNKAEQHSWRHLKVLGFSEVWLQSVNVDKALLETQPTSETYWKQTVWTKET